MLIQRAAIKGYRIAKQISYGHNHIHGVFLLSFEEDANFFFASNADKGAKRRLPQ